MKKLEEDEPGSDRLVYIRRLRDLSFFQSSLDDIHCGLECQWPMGYHITCNSLRGVH
jgi:hypothetical protein